MHNHGNSKTHARLGNDTLSEPAPVCLCCQGQAQLQPLIAGKILLLK